MYLVMKVAALVVAVGVGWRYYQKSAQLPPVVEGFFLPEYRPVAQLFRQYVEDGTERGASFAVYHRGRPLVELWGGYADPSSRRPWRNDTVTLTWACAKGATALAVATLVDRGLLDYKAKIQQYWPEFTQNGKDNITVEMLMSHQAGLVTLGGGRSISMLEYKHDWPRIQHALSTAAPDYPPGSKVVYHAVTLAMYVDALIRIVDPQHRNLSQYFDEEIAKPFGIDYHIGLPLEQYHRAARQHFPSVLESLSLVFKPSHLLHTWRTLMAPNSPAVKAWKVLHVLSSVEVGLGSLMGFGSASSLAKMFDLLANQGAPGSRTLLSKSVVDLFSVPITLESPSEESEDGGHLYSQGFQVTRNVLGDKVFGHSGEGGQQARADATNKLGMSYVTNFHWPDPASPPHHYLQLERTFYQCFKKYMAKMAS
ncbi:beta-lactamase domain-containing protein 2-like isoform X2 [Babylonia areolata]|uniref:beta-lactamase domain-containing protein 2-like isoform X2 n=1 Tax=Babylonia areolata TaxID=304850 RepID=UPI003FD3CFAA